MGTKKSVESLRICKIGIWRKLYPAPMANAIAISKAQVLAST